MADLSLLESAQAQTAGARQVYMPRRGHGRHGLHREQQGRRACSPCSPAPTCCRPRATHDVERFFYSSSACVYAADKQTDTDVTAAEGGRRLPGDARGRLRLGEALQRAHVPALPRGLRPARPASRATTTSTGPRARGTGGREKAPAAICRKVAEAGSRGDHEIEIWGDGEQTRSFMYIDDCVHGTADDRWRATSSEPVNLGSDELVIDQPARRHRRGASPASRCERQHDLTRPRACGVATATTRRSRRPTAGRPRSRSLDGLIQTYAWIYDQVKASA